MVPAILFLMVAFSFPSPRRSINCFKSTDYPFNNSVVFNISLPYDTRDLIFVYVFLSTVISMCVCVSILPVVVVVACVRVPVYATVVFPVLAIC